MLWYDIYASDSTPERVRLDYRKIKIVCNSRLPFIERLRIFDYAFNSEMFFNYQRLPLDLKTEIQKTDLKDGLKQQEMQST